MERPALLVLVRHGESERNFVKKGSIYFLDEESRASVRGSPDHMIPLTKRGIEQAERTGVALRERFGVFDYAYDSGYLRTIQTRERSLSAYPEDERTYIKVRTNAFLRERDPGYAYDMTTQEARTHFPWLHEHWKTFGGFFARPPGGESLADVAARAHTLLDTLFRDRQGMKLVLFNHGGTKRVLRFLLERWSYEEMLKDEHKPDNCAVTVYAYDQDVRRLILKEANKIYW